MFTTYRLARNSAGSSYCEARQRVPLALTMRFCPPFTIAWPTAFATLGACAWTPAAVWLERLQLSLLPDVSGTGHAVWFYPPCQALNSCGFSGRPTGCRWVHSTTGLVLQPLFRRLQADLPSVPPEAHQELHPERTSCCDHGLFARWHTSHCSFPGAHASFACRKKFHVDFHSGPGPGKTTERRRQKNSADFALDSIAVRTKTDRGVVCLAQPRVLATMTGWPSPSI